MIMASLNFSVVGKRYKDRFLHKNRLKKKGLCRIGWIVITSL